MHARPRLLLWLLLHASRDVAEALVTLVPVEAARVAAAREMGTAKARARARARRAAVAHQEAERQSSPCTTALTTPARERSRGAAARQSPSRTWAGWKTRVLDA
jgi:hypothetical protein